MLCRDFTCGYIIFGNFFKEAALEEKIVMYMHAGSKNHGCEAIVNSLCHMIREKALLVSYRGEEDEAYSLKELCTIRQEKKIEEKKLLHIWNYLYRKLTGDEESLIRYRYGAVFGEEKFPLAISIGGDNYCYDNMLKDLRLGNAAFNGKGTKTILLGCSIEPELLKKPEILADLAKYHTIIARESVTYEALQKAFGRTEQPRLLCYPDPAFTLPKKELPLPEGFQEGNTVGINVSPMVQKEESRPGITLENYVNLMRFIIDHTDLQIALIPHVVWAQNDDREPIHRLYEKFRNTGRVIRLEDGSCEELKGYIGRCRLFVGARTHATIAAYSSLVPTLVVGYSVKARGIAKDLFGTEENYVLPVQDLREPGDLTKGFQWLLAHEASVREHLKEIMPGYRQQAFLTGKEVDRLWEEFSQQQKI